LYVRSGAVPANADIKLYDLGFFQLSTQGQQAANVNLGELWVSYDIAFYKPKLGFIAQGDAFKATSYTNAAPLGSSTVAEAGSTLGTVINAGGTTITFPTWVSTGYFNVKVLWNGSSVTTANPTVTATTNCTIVSNQIAPPSGSTTGSIILNYLFNVTGPSAVITFGGAGTLPSAGSLMQLDISAYNTTLGNNAFY